MQAITQFSMLPPDMKRMILDIVRRPATMARVCKEWRRISEGWFDKTTQEIIKDCPILVTCYSQVKGARSKVVLFKQLAWALLHTERYFRSIDEPGAVIVHRKLSPDLKTTDEQCLKIEQFKATISKINKCCKPDASSYQILIENFVDHEIYPTGLPGDLPARMKAKLINATLAESKDPAIQLLRTARIYLFIPEEALLLFQTSVMTRSRIFYEVPKAIHHVWTVEGNDIPYKFKQSLSVNAEVVVEQEQAVREVMQLMSGKKHWL